MIDLIKNPREGIKVLNSPWDLYNEEFDMFNFMYLRMFGNTICNVGIETVKNNEGYH